MEETPLQASLGCVVWRNYVLPDHILTNLPSLYWQRLSYACKYMQQAVHEYCCTHPLPSRPCRQGEEDGLETAAEQHQSLEECHTGEEWEWKEWEGWQGKETVNGKDGKNTHSWLGEYEVETKAEYEQRMRDYDRAHAWGEELRSRGIDPALQSFLSWRFRQKDGLEPIEEEFAYEEESEEEAREEDEEVALEAETLGKHTEAPSAGEDLGRDSK
eukprot:s4697_g1.t1